MKKILLLLWLCPLLLHAQQSGVFVNNLKSLRVLVNGLWDSEPVMLLHGGQYVDIVFDDMQHAYVRRTYTITHCNADWTQSELLESEYMDGFNGQPIDGYEPSLSSSSIYNHYSLRIPNEDVRLKVTGNYRVDIFEDGDPEPVATACFSVMEQHVGIDITVSSNTDIDTYKNHQQVSFNVNYSTYHVNHPEQELLPVVLQNRRWDNHVSGLRPTYLQVSTLIFNHNRSLIFPAGNEYRRMEILDEYVPTMRVESVQYEAPNYHAYIMTDEQRTHYIYDQDQDGRYVVRNGDNVDNETESEYLWVHFILETNQPLTGGDIYVYGQWCNGPFDPKCRMEWDETAHRYEAAVYLKQGYYNYMYLQKDGGSPDGNFFETENEYIVLVYHRPQGGRYDKLVGYRVMKTRQ